MPPSLFANVTHSLAKSSSVGVTTPWTPRFAPIYSVPLSSCARSRPRASSEVQTAGPCVDRSSPRRFPHSAIHLLTELDRSNRANSAPI